MIELQKRCPNCGSAIHFNNNVARCSYCDGEFLLDNNEAVRVAQENAANYNRQKEAERQKIIRERQIAENANNIRREELMNEIKPLEEEFNRLETYIKKLKNKMILFPLLTLVIFVIAGIIDIIFLGVVFMVWTAVEIILIPVRICKIVKCKKQKKLIADRHDELANEYNQI